MTYYTIIFALLVYMITLAKGIGDTKGRQFLLGFIENRVLVRQPLIRIYVTSHQTGTVTFSVPLQRAAYPPDTKPVRMGQVTQKEYPYELHMRGTNYNLNTILVESDVDVTVIGASVNNLTSDAYLALPTWALDTEYYVLSYLYSGPPTRHVHGPSEFAVIALQSDTDVTFHKPEGVDFVGRESANLNAFEAYQVQSEKVDLTGVRVTSTKPVAVVSGTDWTAVAGLYMGDHLVEQLLPTYTWGAEFLVVPLATRTNGDVCRILAANNNTRVRITDIEGNNRRAYILGAGEYVTFSAPSTMPLHIVGSNGIQVAQIAKSFKADDNRQSDPMMIIIPPISHYTTWYAFTPIKTIRSSDDPKDEVSFSNFLCLIIPMDMVGEIYYDNVPLSRQRYTQHWQKGVALTETFTFITINVTDSYHTVGSKSGNVPFAAFLYGFKFQEGYGMPLGQKISPLSHTCIPTLTFEGDFFDNDCDGAIDEEILNGEDDDMDGFIDEDLEPAEPQSTTFRAGSTTNIASTTAPVITTTKSTTESVIKTTARVQTTASIFHEMTTEVREEDEMTTHGQAITSYGSDETGNREQEQGRATEDSTNLGSSTSTGVFGSNDEGTSVTNSGGINKDDTGSISTDSTIHSDGVMTTADGPSTDANPEDSPKGSNTGIQGTSSQPTGIDLTTSSEGTLTQGSNVGEETTEGINENETPKGISCSGSGCDLVTNGNSIEWNDIRLSSDQKDSFGVFWSEKFWLLNGNAWQESESLSELMKASGEKLCLLVQAKIWCHDSSGWVFLLQVEGIPDSDMWKEKLYVLNDNGSWVWKEGSISSTLSYELEQIFTILAQWNRIPEGKRLGVLRNTTVWVFGEDAVSDPSQVFQNGEISIHWQSDTWTWDGSNWQMDNNTLFDLQNNTFSIFWNGMLWRWNGTGWEMTRLPGFSFIPIQKGVYFSWNNITWFLDSENGPIEVQNDIFPTSADSNNGNLPVVKMNDTLWVLTPDGKWVMVKSQSENQLFDPRLGASWGEMFWVYNETLKQWIYSSTHRTAFLTDSPVQLRPGILANKIYWQWDDSEWVVRFQKNTNQGRRKKRDVPTENLLEVFWEQEAWQLFHTVWEPANNSMASILEGTPSQIPELVLSVNGEIWVYNGSDWGLEGHTAQPTVGKTHTEQWENTSLGFVFDNHAWIWDNNTLTGNTEAAESLDQRDVKDNVAVVTEGTLWVLNGSTWTDGVQIANNTPKLEGETQIGVLVNDTLWFFEKDKWTKDEGSIDIPGTQIDNKPAVIVNDTLWILDKDNPGKYDYSYSATSEVGLPKGSSLSVIWKGQLWSYNALNNWTNISLTSPQRDNLPEKGVLILGEVWSLVGPLLIKNTSLKLSNANMASWKTLQLYYLTGCHEWVNDSFSVQENCLNERQIQVVGQKLVVILNGTKWVFDSNGQWTVLQETTTWLDKAPWTNEIGVIVNETVWIWNGTHWFQFPVGSSEMIDFIGATDSVVVFRNGQFWTWNGTHWVRKTNPGAVGLPGGADNSTLNLDFGGGSWTWNGTHIVPSSGSSGNQGAGGGSGLQVGVGINGTSWVCNKTDCWLVTSDLGKAVKDLLDKAPIGVGVNSTVWVWNGTAWVESGDLSGGGSGQSLLIYIDGKVWSWNGTSWVEATDAATGGAGMPPAGNHGNSGGGGIVGTGNQGGADLPGLSVTWNGTVWVWDGKKWTSADGSLGEGAPPHMNATITFNGTSWVWSGSSWVAQTPAPAKDNGEVMTSPGSSGQGSTGGSSSGVTTEVRVDNYQPQTEQSGVYPDTGGVHTTKSTISGETNTKEETQTTTGDLMNTSDGIFMNNSRSTDSVNTTDEDIGTKPHTTDSNLVHQTDGQVTPKPSGNNNPTTKQSTTPKNIVTPQPGEPDSGAATGEGKDSKIKIIIPIVVLLILLIILIIFCCWYSKRKKRKAAQKVNPAVATVAVPRPTSKDQLPPMGRRHSAGSFTDPLLQSASQWSTSSSSSLNYTSRASHSGRRSPRVSQCPPLDLPDLIISLPPGQHVHLKSPRLSPDPSPPSGTVLSSDK